MKRSVLFALMLVSVVSSYGQRNALWENFPPQPRWDIGVNFGGSIITRPVGPQDAYMGNRTSVVPEYGVRVVYAFNERWNAAFDLGFRKWESVGSWKYNYLMGKTLDSRDVKFQLGKPAITETFQLNYTIPRYQGHNLFLRSNLYFGISAGLVTTVGDGSTQFSKYNAAPDSSFRYVSGYNYAAGIGFSFGVQAGYTYYIMQRWGLNAELAVRYVDVGTEKVNGINNNHMTNRYRTMFFPQTIGIRYRFK